MQAKNRADVLTLLSRHDVQFEGWSNTEGTKTLDDLVNEVVSGESELVEEYETLFRKVRVATIVLFHQDDSLLLSVLKEERQVFRDGGKERRRALSASVSEKLQPGETAIAAIFRGMREELKIGELRRLFLINECIETKPTPSWPGLRVKYVFSRFQGCIHPVDFRPGGYVHEQPDKTTYFAWHEMCTFVP